MVNPPVFVWKPDVKSDRYTLQISTDESFSSCVLEVGDIRDSLFLPERRFDTGTYFWRWANEAGAVDTWSFTITADSVDIEVPVADSWIDKIPAQHPRLYLRPGDIEELRRSYRDEDEAPVVQSIVKEAQTLVGETHSMDEPEYLPDRTLDYEAFIEAFQRIMWGSRAFALGATHLALGWLITGEEDYGRAACARFVSLARWDPDGSSSIDANDEAHMSIIWHGIAGIDWVWSLFTKDEQKLVSDHVRKRAENTFVHMHDRGTYGITRFDSHAGREIVFLAWTLLAFHDEIPESGAMLEWLRPVLCGLWPVWSGPDGAWAEGISYALAYVSIMAEFGFILKHATGVDLFRKPFWRNHADWRESFMPAYSEWIGFGDHSEAWRQTWLRSADLVELIDREVGISDHESYVDALRKRGVELPSRSNIMNYVVSFSGFFSEFRSVGKPALRAGSSTNESVQSSSEVLRVFPETGWAAFRSNRKEASEDVALVFRSSSFGSISHSHASNNDFALHAAGRILLMPSGYYCGYGSPHHATWVWHTKSHNCATLSGASQLLRSYESTGMLKGAHEDERVAYLRGEAAASYGAYATRYDRHILYLKRFGVILMIDAFRAKEGIEVAYEWNAHSFYRFSWDEQENRFSVQTADIDGDAKTKLFAGVDGWMLRDFTSFCTARSDWDAPPSATLSNPTWPDQFHLKYSTGMLVNKLLLPVLLVPKADTLGEVLVEREAGRVLVSKGNEQCEITWNRDMVEIRDNDGSSRVDESGFASRI